MPLLAFDYGTRRTGVALGSTLSGARPLAVYPSQPQEQLLEAVARLVREWGVDGLLVGLPLTEEGGEQYMSKRARAFAAALRERFGLPVVEHDERYSSKDAARRFAELRAAGLLRKKDAELLDAMAASLVLEDYLDGLGR